MADLDPLIRYRKHGVDEKQRVLAELYRQAEELQQKKQKVVDEIEREKELAEDMATAEAAAFLGRYLEGAKNRVKAIEKSIRQLETKIIVAQEDMRNAFAEMKKIEITQRGRDKREKAERDQKESQELDEIALDQYRRQQDDD
ncbi:MAG: hypothetical protein H6869_08930 [Rhodospirillales bacterium]|nr:hypothetical protein [Rhodospirillales bacterium]